MDKIVLGRKSKLDTLGWFSCKMDGQAAFFLVEATYGDSVVEREGMHDCVNLVVTIGLLLTDGKNEVDLSRSNKLDVVHVGSFLLRRGAQCRGLRSRGGWCGLSSLGNLVRQTASACGEVLGEDYIRTARAKGLPEWAVVWKHGFRTALLPVVTTVLNHIPHIIGGSLVVERIFGWPGMGSLLFTSVSSRDYTVIMGITVVIALTVLVTGILMDLVYRLADPGVGWGGEAS